MSENTGILISAMLTAAACRLVEQHEISIHDTDVLFGKLTGFSGNGIFGSADIVGLDKIEAACSSAKNGGAIFSLPGFFRAMTAKNMLGDKTPDTGGFYKKVPGAKLILDPDTLSHIAYDENAVPPAAESADSSSLALRQRAVFFSPLKAVWELISNCLCFSVDRIPEGETSLAEIDRVMRSEHGWLTGPFELWDNIGIWPVLDRLKREERPIPQNMKTMLICGAENFYRTKDGKKQYFHFESRTYKDTGL